MYNRAIRQALERRRAGTKAPAEALMQKTTQLMKRTLNTRRRSLQSLIKTRLPITAAQSWKVFRTTQTPYGIFKRPAVTQLRAPGRVRLDEAPLSYRRADFRDSNARCAVSPCKDLLGRLFCDCCLLLFIEEKAVDVSLAWKVSF